MFQNVFQNVLIIDDNPVSVNYSRFLRNVTPWRCFLDAIKSLNQMSLNGQCGHKNQNHQIRYTYLSSAKAEDCIYANF